MAAPDFTIADVLAWARTKPANERYDYCSNGQCALAQFLRATGRAADPQVVSWAWQDGWSEYQPLPNGAAWAANHGPDTFGNFVKNLETLVPKEERPASPWLKADAYLSDIEMVSA